MRKTIKENLKFIKENKAAYATFTAITVVGASALVLCVGMTIMGGKR